MAYTAPNVYIEDKISGIRNSSQSSMTGALVGVAKSGEVNKPVLINSWTEYIEQFANGLETPFSANDYLAYAVYGFFNNGGSSLYILNVNKNGEYAVADTNTTGVTAKAKFVGAWGNNLTLRFEEIADTDDFNFYLSLGSETVVVREIPLNKINSVIMGDPTVTTWLSEFAFTPTTGDGAITRPTSETVTFTNGDDGDTLTNTEYIASLSSFDNIDTDFTFIALPGQTATAINTALITYCDSHNLFPIMDLPLESSVSSAKSLRKSISGNRGAMCYPWGKIKDPVSGLNKSVPSCGHVMGVYARIIERRGVHKVPAGTEATVNGFVGLVSTLTNAEIGILNDAGIVNIVSRPSSGIVVWGARSINSEDATMRYVSDGILNINIKRNLLSQTQFAVFEPNDENLWTRVDTICTAYLEELRSLGALKGSPTEAYYVVVDETNNTAQTIARGELHIEIGYAPNKPAEFVIIELAHSIE